MSSTEPDAPEYQRAPLPRSRTAFVLRVASTLLVLWLVFFVFRTDDKLPRPQGRAAEEMAAFVETTVRAAGGLVALGNCEMIQKGHISVICKVVVQRQSLKAQLQTQGWHEVRQQIGGVSVRDEYSRSNERLIFEGTTEGVHTFSVRRSY